MILKSNEDFRNVFHWEKSLENTFGGGRFLAGKIIIARNYGEHNETEKKICAYPTYQKKLIVNSDTHIPDCNAFC